MKVKFPKGSLPLHINTPQGAMSVGAGLTTLKFTGHDDVRMLVAIYAIFIDPDAKLPALQLSAYSADIPRFERNDVAEFTVFPPTIDDPRWQGIADGLKAVPGVKVLA